MGFDPMTIALISSVIQAGGSVLGGMAGNRGPKETKQQRTTRKTGDELLASLKGEGPYTHLFQTDENAFQRSIVDPSMSRFRNLIAPQIKESFSARGKTGGTAFEDSLARAGVDMQSNIDQMYLPFMQQGQNNKMNVLNSILGMGPGAAQQMTSGEAAGQGAAGFFSGDAFSSIMNNMKIQQMLENMMGQQGQQNNSSGMGSTPRGYSPDYMDWQLGDKRWG